MAPDHPLTTKRVVVTRPRSQATSLCQQLQAHGAVPLVFPAIQIVAMRDPADIDRSIDQLDIYDWIIFTSTNGVEHYVDRLETCGISGFPDDVRVAAIGPATGAALSERGVTVDFMPDRFVAEEVAHGLPDVSGKRILLPRADIARKDLGEILSDQGATVDEVAVYRTIAGAPSVQEWEEINRGFDIVTFTSSSTVKHFAALTGNDFPQLTQDALIACIGPITADTARSLGVEPDIVAVDYTSDGLVDAIIDFFATDIPK